MTLVGGSLIKQLEVSHSWAGFAPQQSWHFGTDDCVREGGYPVLCTVECLAASAQLDANKTLVMTTKSVSRRSHRPPGGQNRPGLSSSALEIYLQSWTIRSCQLLKTSLPGRVGYNDHSVLWLQRLVLSSPGLVPEESQLLSYTSTITITVTRFFPDIYSASVSKALFIVFK